MASKTKKQGKKVTKADKLKTAAKGKAETKKVAKGKSDAKPKSESPKNALAPVLEKIKNGMREFVAELKQPGNKTSLSAIKKDHPEHYATAMAECRIHNENQHKGKVYCQHCPKFIRDKKCTAADRKKIVAIHEAQDKAGLTRRIRFAARAWVGGYITDDEAQSIIKSLDTRAKENATAKK